MPPPEPRSSTTSPSRSSVSAVGLPQPSEASTASSGRHAVSAALYRLALMGSAEPPQQLVEQQEVCSPVVTRRAAWPYRSRTVAFTSSVLIGSLPSSLVDIFQKKSQQQPVFRSAAVGAAASPSISSAISFNVSGFR